ncbi:MAG TPA: hypothetical protein VM491_10700, partial [Burkholderiaceae bacterium]|nr:hypothetical protein [Burkholderiaceae bacterium]
MTEVESAGPKPKILLVEPDPAWQHLAVAALEERGLVVVVPASAAAALATLASTAPDVVLLGVDSEAGLRSCSEFRRAIGERPVPIVVMSSADD